MKKKIFYFIFFSIIIFSLSLVLPAINNNIDRPNMIAYFNADEGGLMDIIWWYYSGQKRESFQWDFDYGLEMLYLADFSRLVLSNFIHITPGIFVLILRWLHLVAWILSFFVLWRLIERHFYDVRQAALAVMVLAVRPAFGYFSGNLKPEPLVLLIMLIGLDYTLRIIDDSSSRYNLYIAVACAAVGFLVKYAGILLLPAIIAAMYLANRKNNNYGKAVYFSQIKLSWIFPSLIGSILVIFPLPLIFFYIRKSTGFSWYKQFGLWGSLQENSYIFYLCIAGLCLIILGPAFFFLRKSNNYLVKKIIVRINELNSHALRACSLYFAFVLLFGFRWVVTPQHFVNIYAQFGPTLSTNPLPSVLAKKGIFYSFMENLVTKIVAFDPIIIFLLAVYLIIEIYALRNNFKNDSLQFYKRLLLAIFLIIPFMIMFGMLYIEQHHMLPFFAVAVILAIQGVYLFITSFKFPPQKMARAMFIFLFSMLFIIDIGINAVKTISSRFYHFRQYEDVAFEIDRWWRSSIDKGTKIIADHYIRVYIPDGYKNIKTINWNDKNRTLRLRQLIDEYGPEFVYYNRGRNASNGESMPALETIFPGGKVELVKSFENKSGCYSKNDKAEFVIYRILDK